MTVEPIEEPESEPESAPESGPGEAAAAAAADDALAEGMDQLSLQLEAVAYEDALRLAATEVPQSLTDFLR